jgi:hypothetical protein
VIVNVPQLVCIVTMAGFAALSLSVGLVAVAGLGAGLGTLVQPAGRAVLGAGVFANEAGGSGIAFCCEPQPAAVSASTRQPLSPAMSLGGRCTAGKHRRTRRAGR